MILSTESRRLSVEVFPSVIIHTLTIVTAQCLHSVNLPTSTCVNHFETMQAIKPPHRKYCAKQSILGGVCPISVTAQGVAVQRYTNVNINCAQIPEDSVSIVLRHEFCLRLSFCNSISGYRPVGYMKQHGRFLPGVLSVDITNLCSVRALSIGLRH